MQHRFTIGAVGTTVVVRTTRGRNRVQEVVIDITVSNSTLPFCEEAEAVHTFLEESQSRET
eukprot:2807657-Amphidinium_carterae.2